MTMKVKIIAMGKVSEKYHKTLIKEGIEKLKKTRHNVKSVEVIHIDEEMLGNNPSELEIKKSLDREADKIMKKIDVFDFVVCLDINGKRIKGDLFINVLDKVDSVNKKNLVFIIGSSHGLSDKIKKQANHLMSLGLITLNHQIVPAILLEIISNNKQ